MKSFKQVILAGLLGCGLLSPSITQCDWNKSWARGVTLAAPVLAAIALPRTLDGLANFYCRSKKEPLVSGIKVWVAAFMYLALASKFEGKN